MKSLKEFIAENWKQFAAIAGLTNFAERTARRHRSHLPSYTKRAKRTARERNRIRNRMARVSRRVNRRRAAGY